MVEDEKILMENIKNFDITKLFISKTYIDFELNNSLIPSFINKIDSDGRCNLVFQDKGSNVNVPKHMIKYYGENNYSNDEKIRKNIVSSEILLLDKSKIIDFIKEKLKNINIILPEEINNTEKEIESSNKNLIFNLFGNNNGELKSKNILNDDKGHIIDITGYLTYQFLQGFLLDFLCDIKKKIEGENYLNLNEKEILYLILDIINLVSEVVKSNLNYYKVAYYNRKLLIISQIHAILVSFDSLIINLNKIYEYANETEVELNNKLNKIINSLYQIILLSRESHSIPLQCLIIFVKIITLPHIKSRIENFDSNEIYLILKEHMENLDKNELIFIKNDSKIKEICNKLINQLFSDDMETKMNEVYYSYLFSCLKCDNLEKKINALNEINEIIKKDLYNNKSINTIFKGFIDKNNIIDIFFDESTHEEIIKRSKDLFRYLVKFNCLNDDIIEKIIERQNNNYLMKDILIDIISELPLEKKDALCKRLTEGIKLDDINDDNLYYISRLTISCFSSTKIKHSSKEKNSEVATKMIEEKNNNYYYGLKIIFDYIIYNFDEKKEYKDSNIDKAINYFEDTIKDIGDNTSFGVEDIHYFLNKLLDNIKTSEKHNNIIQSIKLIYKLLVLIDKRSSENYENILKNLDEKYDIITLLINDLIRYLNITDNYLEEMIYEGIYPHSINIEQRLNLIFYFLRKNVAFMIEGKKHLEKIYKIFKPEKFKEERKIFNEIMANNMTKVNRKDKTSKISNTLLIEFFKDILQNKDEFDLSSINDNESINLFINIFLEINLNKASILKYVKKYRVEEGAEIEGIDMLFTLLTQNPNELIQEKVSELLCQLCLYYKNYSSEKLPDYWKNYFDKINFYLEEISKSNDKIALYGIIKLINKIFTESKNMKGKIMERSDVKFPKSKYKEYHFLNTNTKKDYKIRVSANDKFIDLRYKVSYYYDIPVNNVCLVDRYRNEYNLNNDYENFVSLFSDEEYSYKKGYDYIKVKIIPFQILNIKNNPIKLIEENERIYELLVNSLKIESKEEKELNNNYKDIFWNTLMKLPKIYYFEKHLQKYGEKDKIDDEELSKMFNLNDIYLFTYNLKCFYEDFLTNDDRDNDEKDNYLENFLGIHHIDNIITNNLLNMTIDSNNCRKITIECITIIIQVLSKIEEYKQSGIEIEENENGIKEKLVDALFNKFTELVSTLLKLNYATYDEYLGNDYDSFSKKLDVEIEREIYTLAEELFHFINDISKAKEAYIYFMIKNPKNFIEIYIKDFIICKSNNLKNIIDTYFFKNFVLNAKIFKAFLNIVLTEELFNYLLNNDNLGEYFNVISSKINLYLSKNNFNQSSNPELLERCKKLIDIIINYINKEIQKIDKEFESKVEETECNILNKREKRKLFQNEEIFKGKLLNILSNIIDLYPNDLVNYLVNKVDICDFFLMKCVLRKCVEKPLEIPGQFCRNNVGKTAIYDLIINILNHLDDENWIKLYKKIIDILDNYHKIGFWKTYNTMNWYIDFDEMFMEKYIGLKNMNSTCYLNSIIQQLFMIPTLRETIIKIDNPYRNNILYELQLLFSALKIYENSYYDPKSFVIANNLSFIEQMDADEFYGTLIDKIEKDIKDIYLIKDKDKLIDEQKGKYKYQDLFKYFFGINVLDELKFVDCGHKRYNEFCYYNIQLEIKNFNNMSESLKNYFKEEVMDGDNKINCEQCNTKRTCHKHLLLKSLPNILVISLKRFQFDYESMLKYKLNQYFEFPFQLDMKDYMIENNTEHNTEYELTGIVIHNGVSDFGHYYDIIKSPDGHWYKFNDENVSEFNEEDISKEAFGNKDCNDDEDDEDEDCDLRSRKDKKNAYILFYTKKIISNDKNILSKYDLALEPYSKYSNIKKENIEKINLKLYKSWIIRNIFSSWYQTFVLNLFDIYMVRKKPKLHLIKSNPEEEEKDDDITEKEINKDENENDDKVFKFFLRYYFNVYNRIHRRNDKNTNDDKFDDKIINYIKSDNNKAKFFLEELSNFEALDEFITYCPCSYAQNYCGSIIKLSCNLLYNQYDMSDENNFLYKYINTFIKYIAKNIFHINLQPAINSFIDIININSSLIMHYLFKKNIKVWIKSLCSNDNRERVFNNVFNEYNMPTIHSSHSILIEKTMPPKEKYENLKNKRPENEKNILDQKFFNNLQDLQSNNRFLNQLQNF